MKLLFGDTFDRGNFSTRWCTCCARCWLAARGHDVTYWHFALPPQDVPGPRARAALLLALFSAIINKGSLGLV